MVKTTISLTIDTEIWSKAKSKIDNLSAFVEKVLKVEVDNPTLLDGEINDVNETEVILNIARAKIELLQKKALEEQDKRQKQEMQGKPIEENHCPQCNSIRIYKHSNGTLECFTCRALIKPFGDTKR